MSSISLNNAYLLFLIIPLVALLLVPFVISVRRENVNGHNVASCVLHVLMAVIIAFTAAGTCLVTVVTGTEVYVVADVSYSANRNLDVIDGYINRVGNNLPANSQMGVVCFGKDYQLLTRLGEQFRTVKAADVDDSETNIISALDYAGSLFHSDVIKRIVLITDGRQTDASDSNALKRQVDALKAANIHVDAIYVDDNLSDDAKEVQISDVSFTQSAYLNHPETVEVTIECSFDNKSEVTLYHDGVVVDEKAPDLYKGYNTVSMNLLTGESGSYEYEVVIKNDEDENLHNNVYKFVQEVTSLARILLITNDYSDSTQISRIYGDNAEIDAYVNNPDVPCSVEELCRYDEFVISGVDVETLSNCDMFMNSLYTAVDMFGKSLVTLGDLNIQNKKLASLSETSGVKKLAEMLPVKFGNNSEEGKLTTIVLDASRSMVQNSKLIFAQRVATNIISTLNDNDRLSVIIFSGEVQSYSYILPSINISNPDKVQEAVEMINTLGGTQGTYIGLGLNAAFEAMYRDDAANKQVLLISDGLNYSNESNEPLSVVRKMSAYGIVTSVFDVGRGARTDAKALEARALLENISSTGGGNLFGPYSSEDEIDEVVFGEMSSATNDLVIDGRYSPVNIKLRFDETVSGITDAGYITGYVNCKANASSSTVLTTTYYTESGVGMTVPVYSYCTLGNGKVSSFTSSLSGAWTNSWDELDDDGVSLKQKIFYNIFSTNTPKGKTDYPFTVSRYSDAGYTSVTLIPAQLRGNDVAVTISVTKPDGTVVNGNLTYNSRLYTYTFASQEAGRYNVALNYAYGGTTYTADASFNVSYLSEYNSFASYDASVLYKMLGDNGKLLNKDSDNDIRIENDVDEVGTYSISLTVPLMVACVVLFAVDIVIRKLKWNDIVSLFKRTGKKK